MFISVVKDSEKHFMEECEQLLKEKESLEARVKTTSMHSCLQICLLPFTGDCGTLFASTFWHLLFDLFRFQIKVLLR